jgi:hypothetical protein
LGGDGSVFLIDMRGNVVHRWKAPYPGNLVQLLDNGNLMFDGKTPDPPNKIGGGQTGIIMEFTWDGDVVWEYSDPYLHHDHCRMENGNTMLLLWEKIPPDMVKKVHGGQPGTEDEDGSMWGDFFREVTPEGKTVWEWHGHEHLDLDDQRICPLCTRKEWTHANTVEVLLDGNILTSFRLTDTIGIIDKKTGDWKWKWGRGELGHQHDPTLLENGNILVFDNGHHIPQKPRSRVIEVDPRTDEIVWEYSDPHYLGFYSASISGCQRLPNGNTLICEGNRGRLYEVTKDCEIVWEYYNPFYSPSPVAGQTIPGNTRLRGQGTGRRQVCLAECRIQPGVNLSAVTLDSRPIIVD